MKIGSVEKRFSKSSIKKIIVAAFLIVSVSLIGLPSNTANAIIGGETTSQYPWLVAFVTQGSTPVEERVICSGSLLKSQWVVTAAHCSLPSATTTVVIGRSDLSSGGQGQTRTIIQQIYHPNWDASDPIPDRWDIKLVKLNTPSTLTDMNLAGPSDNTYWGQGTDVRTYGYGRYSNSINHGSRYSRRAEFRINILTDDHVHYWATWEGRTACYGDSGGPSITSTPSGAKQAGVFSAMYVSGGNCQAGQGNLFVKTGHRSSQSNSPIWYWITGTI